VKLLPEMYFTDMFARKSSKMHRKWFRKFPHTRIAIGTTQIAAGTAQNGNTSATKIMGQEIMKLLPEI